MDIREGRLEDRQSVISLWQRSQTEEPALPSLVSGAGKHLAKPDAFFVVAEDESQLVGAAVGMQALDDEGAGPPIAGLCHISTVVVAVERWGEGIGRDLVSAILVQAVNRGYESAQLWTQAGNERARRLYEGLAFRSSGREREHKGELIVHYQRSLVSGRPGEWDVRT